MNKSVLITGADRGVGLALTEVFLEKGFIVFAGKYLSNFYGIEKLLTLYPDNLHVLNLDISSQKSIDEAIFHIKNVTTSLDILINNGAILGDITSTILDSLDFEEMKKVYEVNTLGSLRVTNGLIDLILKSDDKLIINVSSEAASIACAYRNAWFAYAMSKTALNMQSVLIHNQIYTLGGQVMIIHPGWVKTFMQGKLDENAEITAQESAQGMWEQISKHEKYRDEKPAYIDYSGKEIPW